MRKQVQCNKEYLFGNEVDGGWAACLAGSLDITRPCIVYSFG